MSKKYLWLYEDAFELQKEEGKDHPVREDQIFYGTAQELRDHAGRPGEWVRFEPKGRLREKWRCSHCGMPNILQEEPCTYCDNSGYAEK